MCFQHHALAALPLVRGGLAHVTFDFRGSHEYEQLVLLVQKLRKFLEVKRGSLAEVVSCAGVLATHFSH